jgi:predicted dehydrogenase
MPSYGGKAHIEVIGKEGALRASLSRGSIDTLQIVHPPSSRWEELPLTTEARSELPSALGIMMRSFVNACLRGKLDPDIDASFHDGLAVQLERVLSPSSHRSKQAVSGDPNKILT